MRKTITILFLFLLLSLVLIACTNKQSVTSTQQQKLSGQDSTPLDQDINSIDAESSNDTDKDLDGLDDDLGAVDTI